MGVERAKRVEELFVAALEQERPRRAAFLMAACGEDAELLEEVQSLLDSHDSAETFLETPAFDGLHDGASARISGSLIGRTIGAYEIVRPIGSGGMGAVFEARQESPRRTVALKLMNAGFVSQSAVRRFQYEAHVLAHLTHPGIAQIHEAGVHEENGVGIPFFAMEHIEGARDVVEYVRAHELHMRERLELFARICDAVHHGHQKGVIHRDIKPANILVDGSGAPKVIDFGVARATDADMALTTLRTLSGQLVGTLQYMSPEQCAGDPANLDIRSDVYSLGVVLYEMLGGARPYDLGGVPIAEAARIIKEQPPRRPSQVDRTLRGDVETIVLKALEKDRERRYASAADLAQDIRRYLAHQPIEAHPPSAVYQARKLIGRHKFPVALMAALFVLLVGSVVAFKAQAQRVALERDKAERINEFLTTMLASASPAVADKDVTVREILDQAAQRVNDPDFGPPEVEVALRETIGNTYRGLGDYAAAEPHLRRALELQRGLHGDDSLETASTINSLAVLLGEMGRRAEAIELYREALAIRREHLDPQDERIANVLGNLGQSLYGMHEYESAEPVLREALAIHRASLPADDPTLAFSLNSLGLVLRATGRLEEAEALYSEALDIRRRALGERDLYVAISLNNLAGLRRARGNLQGAEELYREALEIHREVLDEDHPYVATTLGNLADVLHEQGRLDDAIAMYREVLERRRATLGEENPQVAATLAALGVALGKLGRPEEAEPLLREAVAIREQVLGDRHGFTAFTRSLLGACLTELGEYEEAEALLLDSHAVIAASRGPDAAETLTSAARLRALYDAWGKPEQAAQYAPHPSE